MSSIGSSNSLLRTTLTTLITLIVTFIVLLIIDLIPWQPNMQELNPNALNLFGLLPNHFFEQTFAPYTSPLLNMILALIVILLVLNYIYQMLKGLTRGS